MNTNAGAGSPFTQQALVVLQDENGNTVTAGDDIEIFAMVSSYRPDPRAQTDSESTQLSLFSRCTFNPFTQNQENCEKFERFPTLSVGGVADLDLEDVNGKKKKSTLHAQVMGYYTFRFYAEALVAYSSEFFVMNDLGATMELLQYPGPSSCSPGITGHNDWRCASGGYLEPQPSFNIYDRFGNRALYGVQEFTVSISENPGGSFLLCDQRYRDAVTNKPIYITCLQASQDGILQFTDLRITDIAKGYVLRVQGTGRSHPHNDQGNSQYWSLPVESKVVSSVITPKFDVAAIRSLRLVSEAPRDIPAGCSAFPAPTLRLVGFGDADAEEEHDVNYAGGTGIVFTFGCTEESDDVVLQTGRDYAFANGAYVQRAELHDSRPSFELDVSAQGSGAVQMYVFFCKNTPDDGSITIDSGCLSAGFWRVFSTHGFCGNVSRTEMALQTCESGVGANTFSATPAFISLRAEWHIRTQTLVSLHTGGDLHYEWTVAEKDSIWFSRKSQPCVADSTILQGVTSTSAKDGMLTFDNFQSKIAQRFTLRFKFNIVGSGSSFTAESEFVVTQGQIGSIQIVESLTRGLVDVDIDPPILIQPLDLYGNPIRKWNCVSGSQGNPPQWSCLSEDLKLKLFANVHSCPVCSSLVPIKDPVATEMSFQEYSTGLKFRFRPGQSTTPGQQFVFRVQVEVTDQFEGCPGSGGTTSIPAPVVAQTEPFDVDNSSPTEIVLPKQPPAEIQAGQNVELLAELLDANGQTMAVPYSMQVAIVKESPSCNQATASRSSCAAGHVYQYCGEPVKGNENTKCYFEDQVEQVNTLTGTHFTQLTVKAPGTYFLFVFIGEPWLTDPIDSVGFPLSVVPAAPDEYISLAIQPWTEPPSIATAGVKISPLVDFGIYDSYGNFMDNYDYFYPIEDLTIKSNTGVVFYEDCDQPDECVWKKFENQRILFKATPPQGPPCNDPPYESSEPYYTGDLRVCGTYNIPALKIEKMWEQVDGVKTECSAQHFLSVEGNLIIQTLGTGETLVTEPLLPAVTIGTKVPISGLSTVITVSPSAANSLALYFTPLLEYARRAFSDQPKVQLMDRFGNPVCTAPANDDAVVKVRVCYGRDPSLESQETLFLDRNLPAGGDGFPAHCPALTQTSVRLEDPGAYVLFAGLYANRTGFNKLYFLAGSFANSSSYMDIASGTPWEVVVVQAPQASVSEERILSGSAPAECSVCVSTSTVGAKILDIAGNDLTDSAMLSASVSCSADVTFHGTKQVESTNNGYAAFTDLIIVYSGPAGVSKITCNLMFQTAYGDPYKSDAFTVAIVHSARVMVLPTMTVVQRLIRGDSVVNGNASAVTIEARDFNNETVLTSRRTVHVSGIADTLSCCCYLGDCKVARLEAGSIDFPSILALHVSPNYRLFFNLTTSFSTIPAQSASFAVVHDAPSSLVVAKRPSASVRAGTVFEFQLQVMPLVAFQ